MGEALSTDAVQTELLDACAEYTRRPLDWVLWAFPWGQATYVDAIDGVEKPCPLEHEELEDWQIEQLQRLQDRLLAIPDGEDHQKEAWSCIARMAVASGHGIGKSAFMSFTILWAMSTMEDCRGRITANTGDQLWKTTWPEVSKWYRMCATAGWFTLTATALFSADPKHERNWRFDAIPWSEHRSEAFAGLHNKGKRVVVLFDEASGIAPIIWEVVEGAFTDDCTEIIFIAFGNPTQATGKFRECFSGERRDRWMTKQIDARSVRRTNKTLIEEWIADFGLDSDFVRIRALGQFPNQSDTQFIPSGSVDEAMKRPIENVKHRPVIIGVDTARGGADSNVIYARHGMDARSLGYERLPSSAKAQTVAGRVTELYNKTKAKHIFVDAANIGMAVVDLLQEWGYPVREVWFGGEADNKMLYANKRAEMWGRMKEFMPRMSLPEKDTKLRDDLVGVEYGHTAKEQILLERKEHMKKRGLASPDIADALAITFAYRVESVVEAYPQEEQGVQSHDDFDPFD